MDRADEPLLSEEAWKALDKRLAAVEAQVAQLVEEGATAQARAVAAQHTSAPPTRPDTPLTNAEAAEVLGCTPGTLRKWVQANRVPHRRMGRWVRFDRQQLEAWKAEATKPVAVKGPVPDAEHNLA